MIDETRGLDEFKDAARDLECGDDADRFSERLMKPGKCKPVEKL